MNATNPIESQLAVPQATAAVVEAVRVATAGVPKSDDTYLRNLKGDCLSRSTSRARELSVEGMIALLYDAFKSGEKSQAELLQVPAALGSAIRSWFKAQEDAVAYAKAHIGEERAEGGQDNAEAEFEENACGPTLQKLEQATRAHIAASELQIIAARRRVLGTVA
jgi:hypothetical protein